MLYSSSVARSGRHRRHHDNGQSILWALFYISPLIVILSPLPPVTGCMPTATLDTTVSSPPAAASAADNCATTSKEITSALTEGLPSALVSDLLAAEKMTNF